MRKSTIVSPITRGGLEDSDGDAGPPARTTCVSGLVQLPLRQARSTARSGGSSLDDADLRRGGTSTCFG